MGTAERRAREKHEKRNEIQKAAIRCFSEKGYDATTLDEIGRLAEVAKGTLYLYFPSKADLFASLVLERGFDVFTRELTERTRNCRSAVETLRAFTRCFEELCLAERHEIFELFIQIDRGDISKGLSDDVRAAARLRFAEILSQLAKAVDAGVAAGEFRAASGRRLAPVFWALCVGVAHLAKGGSLPGTDIDPGTVLADGMGFLLAGLAAPQSGP